MYDEHIISAQQNMTLPGGIFFVIVLVLVIVMCFNQWPQSKQHKFLIWTAVNCAPFLHVGDELHKI